MKLISFEHSNKFLMPVVSKEPNTRKNVFNIQTITHQKIINHYSFIFIHTLKSEAISISDTDTSSFILDTILRIKYNGI